MDCLFASGCQEMYSVAKLLLYMALVVHGGISDFYRSLQFLYIMRKTFFIIMIPCFLSTHTGSRYFLISYLNLLLILFFTNTQYI